MNRYGQALTWSTITAPHPFTGICTRWSLNDSVTEQPEDDEGGDNIALTLHSRQAPFSFDAKVDAASTDFLNLSAGAAITVTGIDTGLVLATRAIESWRLGQSKTASVSGIWFPDMVIADGATAGVDLSAFTPDQAALGIVSPGGVIIYGTFGLGHASGVVHALTIEQSLQLTVDDPTPDGKLTGAASHGYMRKITMDILSKAAAPAVKSVLAITGGPAHAADYKITSVEEKFESKRGKMFGISATWIPPFTA